MDDAALLDGLGALEDTDYGRIYIEWGGFKTSRGVCHTEGQGWMFTDSIHSHNFRCASLREALECMIDPPTEQEWEENIIKHHGEINPGWQPGERP